MPNFDIFSDPLPSSTSQTNNGNFMNMYPPGPSYPSPSYNSAKPSNSNASYNPFTAPSAPPVGSDSTNNSQQPTSQGNSSDPFAEFDAIATRAFNKPSNNQVDLRSLSCETNFL
jgi:hypothetical protein